MRGAERFPRRSRLRRGTEIRSLLRRGEHRRSGPLDLYFAPSPAGVPRAGIVVPAYGHPSVARNRLKRRLREIVRREWLPAARRSGLELDLLLRARRSAYAASFAELRRALLSGAPGGELAPESG